MHILASISCTVVLVPLLGTTVQASTKEISSNPAPLVRKTELLKQQWETKAEYLTAERAEESNTIAEQSENSWSESNDNVGVQETLLNLQGIGKHNFSPNRGSPGLTLANPAGFGSDRGFYAGFGYQPDVRYSNNIDDGIIGLGFAFGDAREAVGVEIGYTMASFGGSRDFGSGGFNAKVHHRFTDSWGIAAGWNGFLNLGGDNDFQDSVYLTSTKVFRTRENLNSAFSRVALTAGVGNGQFRTEDAIEDDEEGFNAFGSLAFRIARPVSGVVEWTGQDLAVGTSISPFRRIPITFTLGVRDLAGAGDEPRFVFGAGAGF